MIGYGIKMWQSLLAKYQPLKIHENISVFNKHKYFPIEIIKFLVSFLKQQPTIIVLMLQLRLIREKIMKMDILKYN